MAGYTPDRIYELCDMEVELPMDTDLEKRLKLAL